MFEWVKVVVVKSLGVGIGRVSIPPGKWSKCGLVQLVTIKLITEMNMPWFFDSRPKVPMGEPLTVAVVSVFTR